MVLSFEGIDPDTHVSRRFLLVQVAEPCTDTGQQVALHAYAGLVAHRVCIAVMALSPEGTEPDITVLWNPLLVQAAEPCTYRSAGSIDV